MGTIQCLLLLAAATAPSETVLLQFTSEHCKHCRNMEPTMERLKSAGYPVRAIDVDRSRPWAEHYQVKGVPTFVMVTGGKVVDRVEGFTSHARLAQMYETANFTPATSDTRSSQFPGNHKSEAGPSSATKIRQVSHTAQLTQTRKLSAEQIASQATVRLKIEDATGYSFGTGTIIDVHGEDALVLTCGHLFRTSGGKGSITVDLFANGTSTSVPGKLVYYEADKADIGFVTLRPGIDIAAVTVAPQSYRPQRDDAVFNIGCNNGRSPTLRRSKVTSLDRYAGPSNIEVAGMPVNGRSGGGLFASNGMLIGVCNAADDQDDEGIYAALPTIHDTLAAIGQQQISARAEQMLAKSNEPQRNSSIDSNQRKLDGALKAPDMPSRPLTFASTNSGTEIIAVVRTPDGKTETVVIRNPSAALLHQLRQSQPPSGSERTIDGSNFAGSFPSDWPDDQSNGPVLRGQSQD